MFDLKWPNTIYFFQVGNSEAKNNLESFVSSPIESHLIKVDGLSDLKPVIPCLNKFICNGEFNITFCVLG